MVNKYTCAVCILICTNPFDIGLNYFHPHRFRSRAVVSYGAPISIEPELVQKYIEGGPSKREAISSLLAAGYEGLKSVTVNAPNYDTLMVSNKYIHTIHILMKKTNNSISTRSSPQHAAYISLQLNIN